MSDQTFDPHLATLTRGGEKKCNGFSVRFCWLNQLDQTVGCKLLHGPSVVGYFIATVEQLGGSDDVQQAIDGVDWVSEPPIGWDVVPIFRFGSVHQISRQQAAEEPPKRRRRRK